MHSPPLIPISDLPRPVSPRILEQQRFVQGLDLLAQLVPGIYNSTVATLINQAAQYIAELQQEVDCLRSALLNYEQLYQPSQAPLEQLAVPTQVPQKTGGYIFLPPIFGPDRGH